MHVKNCPSIFTTVNQMPSEKTKIPDILISFYAESVAGIDTNKLIWTELGRPHRTKGVQLQFHKTWYRDPHGTGWKASCDIASESRICLLNYFFSANITYF